MKKIVNKLRNLYIKLILKLYKYLLNDYENPIRFSKKEKFIFIHINKNAGTSISKALGMFRKKHLTAKELIDHHGIGQINFRNIYKFAVVRNPWDRVVSQYKFRVKTNQCKMRTNPISFKNWVKKVYGKNKDDYYYNNPKMFLTQADWLKDYNDEIHIQKVIKFENLESDFSDVTNYLQLNIKLPHYNMTKKKIYYEFYDEESINIISEYFKEDIKLFKYQY